MQRALSLVKASSLFTLVLNKNGAIKCLFSTYSKAGRNVGRDGSLIL